MFPPQTGKYRAKLLWCAQLFSSATAGVQVFNQNLLECWVDIFQLRGYNGRRSCCDVGRLAGTDNRTLGSYLRRKFMWTALGLLGEGRRRSPNMHRARKFHNRRLSLAGQCRHTIPYYRRLPPNSQQNSAPIWGTCLVSARLFGVRIRLRGLRQAALASASGVLSGVRDSGIFDHNPRCWQC
jgi:hypothetical protein